MDTFKCYGCSKDFPVAERVDLPFYVAIGIAVCSLGSYFVSEACAECRSSFTYLTWCAGGCATIAAVVASAVALLKG